MNYRLSKIVSVLFSAFYLTGCLAPQVAELRNPVRDDHEEISLLAHKDLKINSTHVAVGVQTNNSLGFTAPAQNQAGLIGFFVNAAILSGTNDDIQDQQRLIQPIRNAALEYNYGSKFRSAIKNSLQHVDWLKISYIAKYPELQKNNAEDMLNKNSDDTVFIIDSSYSFSDDFNSINVVCYAAMHSRNKIQLNGEKEAVDDVLIYQKNFTYTHNLDQQFSNKSQAIQKWGDNNGHMLTQALNMAVTNIANRIAQDLIQKKS